MYLIRTDRVIHCIARIWHPMCCYTVSVWDCSRDYDFGLKICTEKRLTGQCADSSENKSKTLVFGMKVMSTQSMKGEES